MELKKVTDNNSSIVDIHPDDSTIYLFGSELYCGWCLEAFKCPVRLKIHCHIEHLATCSCGKEFGDKQSLCKHVARVGCLLPPPFQWFHFVNLPNKMNESNAAEEREYRKPNQVVDENERADEKMSDKSGKGLDDSVQKATPANRKPLPKNHQQKGKKVFRCGMCPFKSSSSAHCQRHIFQVHGKGVGMPQDSSHTVSKKPENYVAVDKEVADGTPSKDSASHDDAMENKLAETSGCMNRDTSESCCGKHSSDDIQFVVGCFSSPVGGKPLCCGLCSDRFDEWEKAALHVYDSHFSALQHWRDTHSDFVKTRPLSEDSSDKLSADSATDGQVVKSSIAVEHAPEGDDNLCSENVKPNVSECPSANVEHKYADTSVDQSARDSLENETKPKWTADECKALASSLCRLLNCWNHEPVTGIPDCKMERDSEVKVDADASTPTDSNPTKMASSDMTATVNLIARRCKFCHRVCSTRYNCQRHETVCRRLPSFKSGGRAKHTLLSPSKSGGQTKPGVHLRTTGFAGAVRLIHDSKIFYCRRCGFSDADQHAVQSHLMRPHVFNVNNRLCMKFEPGNDYIGSMKISAGKFRCSLCGMHKQYRSCLLKHMACHSSPAVPLVSMPATNPESLSDKVEESVEEQKSSGFASVSHARSCPKCSQSFSSIAKYLHHRAVCRAVQHRQEIVPHTGGTGTQFHYLLNFCEQAADGRWKCKLCTHCSTMHRYDVFKHIRAKHEEVQKIEMEACVEFTKKITDRIWQCRLCQRRCEHRTGLYRHIRVIHAAKFGVKPKKPKLNDIADLCVQTAYGMYQCTKCNGLFRQRYNVFRHIREKHDDILLEKTDKSNAIVSNVAVTDSSSSVGKQTTKSNAITSIAAVTDSSSSMEKHNENNTAVLAEWKKSPAKRVVKRCPRCHRVFTKTSGFKAHRKSCDVLALDRFVELESSGRVKCLVCSLTYTHRGDCIKHIRKKHLLSGQLGNVARDHVGVSVKTEDPVPADDLTPASDSNERSSYDASLDETACKVENE